MKPKILIRLFVFAIISSMNAQRKDLVVIDQSINSKELLKQSLIGDPFVLELDNQSNGWVQIILKLKEVGGVENVHIFSKSNQSEFVLSGDYYSVLPLDKNSELLVFIDQFSALNIKTICFYGSSIASNEDGKKLIESIAVISGAESFASINETKNDFTLEYGSSAMPPIQIIDERIFSALNESLTLIK